MQRLMLKYSSGTLTERELKELAKGVRDFVKGGDYEFIKAVQSISITEVLADISKSSDEKIGMILGIKMLFKKLSEILDEEKRMKLIKKQDEEIEGKLNAEGLLAENVQESSIESLGTV